MCIIQISVHFVCVAKQQGCVVSVGGGAAYIDHCGKAQLLHAASKCVMSPEAPCLQLPKCLPSPQYRVQAAKPPSLQAQEDQVYSHYHTINATPVV